MLDTVPPPPPRSHQIVRRVRAAANLHLRDRLLGRMHRAPMKYLSQPTHPSRMFAPATEPAATTQTCGASQVEAAPHYDMRRR